MPRRQAAFTLIELIVVIIIIAMMAGFLVPAYNRFYAHIRFDNVTGEVIDLFDWARETAVKSGAEVTVRFDPASSALIAIASPSSPPSDLPTEMMQSAQSGMLQPLEPREVTFGEEFRVSHLHLNGQASSGQGSGDAVVFRADGSCEGGDFVLESQEGYQAHLVLRSAIGKLIRVEDEAPLSP